MKAGTVAFRGCHPSDGIGHVGIDSSPRIYSDVSDAIVR
jgi:hypothetical protein